MAARNNHQASKKRVAILRVLNAVNFNRVRYLLRIQQLTNTQTKANFKLKIQFSGTTCIEVYM